MESKNLKEAIDAIRADADDSTPGLWDALAYLEGLERKRPEIFLNESFEISFVCCERGDSSVGIADGHWSATITINDNGQMFSDSEQRKDLEDGIKEVFMGFMDSGWDGKGAKVFTLDEYNKWLKDMEE